MPKKKISKASKARLDALIKEATVDAYGEHEEFSGIWTMVTEVVETPFEAKVIGETVTVIGFAESEQHFGIKAVCQRGKKKYKIDLSSLEWVEPFPGGFEWIEAYFAWHESF